MPENQRDTPPTKPAPAPTKPDPLVEGVDFTIDALGRHVFTTHYLLKRGTCCGSKCRHCPYEWKNVAPTRRIDGEPLPPRG